MPPKRAAQTKLNLRLTKSSRLNDEKIQQRIDLPSRKPAKEEIEKKPAVKPGKTEVKPVALLSDDKEIDGVVWKRNEANEVLKKFDLASKFGPCMSMTRLERWERASKLKLNPPADIKKIIDVFPELVSKSVLHGRVHADISW